MNAPAPFYSVSLWTVFINSPFMPDDKFLFCLPIFPKTYQSPTFTWLHESHLVLLLFFLDEKFVSLHIYSEHTHRHTHIHIFNIFSFIWLPWVLIVAWGIFLWGMGSVLTESRLSCSEACRVLVPCQGIKPMAPVLEGIFLTTGPSGKSPEIYFKKIKYNIHIVYLWPFVFNTCMFWYW